MSASNLHMYVMAVPLLTAMFVNLDGRAAGIIAVADTLKPNSKEAVGRLQRLQRVVVPSL